MLLPYHVPKFSEKAKDDCSEHVRHAVYQKSNAPKQFRNNEKATKHAQKAKKILVDVQQGRKSTKMDGTRYVLPVLVTAEK